MYVHYKTDERGLLATTCPHGKGCLVGGGECIECAHFKGKDIKNKIIKCKFRRKGTRNG
jgi:hypothetical protein